MTPQQDYDNPRPDIETPTDLMSIPVATHFSGLKETTLRLWVRQGVIPVYGRRRVYRVRLEDILPLRTDVIRANNQGANRGPDGRFRSTKTPVGKQHEWLGKMLTQAEYGLHRADGLAARELKNPNTQPL